MSQLAKIKTLQGLVKEHGQALMLLLKQGKVAESYVKVDTAFWDYVQSLGYTPEDVAVVFDCFYSCKLGDNYTWSDWMGLYNQVKNQLLEHYGVAIHIGEFEQAALDIVKTYYAAANEG